jgi:hypothetical protein
MEIDACSVRKWMKHFKDGNTDIAHQPRCDQQITAATERSKQNVNELIRQDRRISQRNRSRSANFVMRFVKNIRRRKLSTFNMTKRGLNTARLTLKTSTAGELLPHSPPQSGFGPFRLPLVRALEISPEMSPLQD